MTNVNWIKVEDRLPDEEEAKEPLFVLINGLIEDSYFTNGIWRSRDKTLVLTKVTHWAVIPKGY
jgi:hypothetical protein